MDKVNRAKNPRMKIFSGEQIAGIDKLTIIRESISDVELMERASRALTTWLSSHYPVNTRIAVVAGPGNNGGDALVVARLLHQLGYVVNLFLPVLGNSRSAANQENLSRLADIPAVGIFEMDKKDNFPDLSDYDLIVDGLYGSGLNRPLSGFVGDVIDWINHAQVPVVSIDLPSGLLGGENQYNDGAKIKATITLTLEFPKLSLFFAENEPYFGTWVIIPFGLNQKAIYETVTRYNFLEQNQLLSLLKVRSKFAHKGTAGHGLLLAGSKGMSGAAQLACRGALRAGAGLITVHLPGAAALALQIGLPEAISSIDPEPDFISELPDLGKFRAVAAGPGINTQPMTREVIKRLISEVNVPLVLDADALNILALHPSLLKNLNSKTILTPHPAEFDRLSGIVCKLEEERFGIAEQFVHSYGLILILKGAYTRIFLPDGTVWFNSTGNPGMATAGSGDVLTGILLGLLSQGYSPTDAAKLGVFLHGRSADLKVDASSQESLLASEIADHLGEAFASLKWR